MDSPKEQFLKGQHAKAWAGVSASAVFTEASNLAMLQYQEQCTPGNNDQLAAYANHYRLEGARQFLRILANLSIKPAMQERKALGQLDHERA